MKNYLLPKLCCLVLLSSLASTVLGETHREKRHRQIKERLVKSTDLEFNYFAPSVHVSYRHPDSKATYLAYYNEIRVEKTAKHTYFCTVGFDVGYFGIQDHGSGPLAIFSVWDKGGGQNKSSAVDEADRTQVLYTNPKAKSNRFGGEGSGAKTMMPYAWEIGKTYAFIVLLTPQDQGTHYTAWISEKGKAWENIAAYQTVMSRKKLRGFYSFVEDYARNGTTGQSARLAFYPSQAALTASGNWERIIDGSGSIADDVIQNGHSGVKENSFFSQSGGGTADFNTQPKRFSVTPSSAPFSVLLPKGFTTP